MGLGVMADEGKNESRGKEDKRWDDRDRRGDDKRAMKVKIVKTTKKVNAATTMLTDFVEQAAHAQLRRS